MTPPVLYRHDYLEFGEHRFWVSDFGTIGAPLEAAAPAPLGELKRALRWHAYAHGEDHASFWLSVVPAARFDDEISPPSGVGLRWERGELFVWADLRLSHADPVAGVREVAERLKPALDARRVTVESVRELDTADELAGVEVLLRWSTRRRTVGDAYALADEFRALAVLSATAERSPSVVRDSLGAGLFGALLGWDESDWLEVKRSHYRLDDKRGRLELAKDVGALANADGGVLLVGFKTRSTRGSDVIDAVAPCPLPRGIARRYTTALARLLHPIPQGLRVERFPDPSDPDVGVLMVEIPKQSPTVKPFLIRDGLHGESVAGSLVGIPVRIGEDTVWTSAEAIHARLRVGSAALDAVTR